jgi:ATP-dependent helicase/nuclease subunit B
MEDMRRRAADGETGLIMLVPEQYSHACERQLCRVVGDSLSLHGEALSFTRLCTRVLAEVSGAVNVLDGGGQILALYRALAVAEPALKLYGGERRADFLERLLATVKELKACRATPETLSRAAEDAGGALGDKLRELALILEGYDAFLRGAAAIDPRDRLTLAADKIAISSFAERRYYIDGFNEFTAQETRVIEELIASGAELTFCLTCGERFGDEEIFAAPRKALEELIRLAEKYGAEWSLRELSIGDARRAGDLAFLERRLFAHGGEVYGGAAASVETLAAATTFTECEIAAAKVLELVRAGYRYRDIAITARGVDAYASLCENVFERYGIPVFVSGNADILQKPPVALIVAALEIVTRGWSYDAVFRYLKTGLAGIAAEECDELENYVIRYNIRGGTWTRAGDWAFGLKRDAETEVDRKREQVKLAEAARVDALRRRIAAPLVRLQNGLKRAATCADGLGVLYEFLEGLELPRAISAKAELLGGLGNARLADEYRQLWKIIVSAIDQCHALMGDASLSIAEFARVLPLVLSQYSVGVIPVALDRVMVGDMASGRRLDVKCLIVLGATDGALPHASEPGGVLSDEERTRLGSLGVAVSGGMETRLANELNIIYSALTQPSDKLILLYPKSAKPSYLFTRALKLLRLTERVPEPREYMTAAELPCYELAAMSADSEARAFFEQFGGARLRELEVAAAMERGSLSADAAFRLYGAGRAYSATRVKAFYSCKFGYFMKNGLRAYERKAVTFDAPEEGTFMHFVLQKTAEYARDSGGFGAVEPDALTALTDTFTEEYIAKNMPDWDERPERFRYLFLRLAGEARTVVADTARELRASDFAPTEFEKDFQSEPRFDESIGEIPVLHGLIDRIDEWDDGGKRYLRVVDYKTGSEAFELTKVLNGLGAQMLIYLFALTRGRSDVVPSGVLYSRACAEIFTAKHDMSDVEIDKELASKLKRSGLLLDDDAVVEAMERGVKRFMPSNRATAEQFEQLSRHLDGLLAAVPKGLLSGDVSADPYYRANDDHACRYCEYKSACLFDEERDNRRRIYNVSNSEFWEKVGGGNGKD